MFKPSRLFWKIWISFWLTLLITGAIAGGLVWHHAQERIDRLDILVDHPRAEESLIQAATLIKRFGVLGVTRFAEKKQKQHHRGKPFPIFIVNDAGEDILHRAVPKAMLAKVRDTVLLAEHPGVRSVTTPGGQRFLLFIPRHDHPYMQRSRVWPDGLPMMPIIVLVLGSLVFSAFLAFYLTRPIQHLRDATQRFAKGDLTSRVLPKMSGRRDELVDLASDFDAMASQLEQLISGQKRLLNDVSHELRSPLARLQLAIALGRQQPEQLEAMLLRIEKESERLDQLVGQLLTLSRIEAISMTVEKEEVDITALLKTVCHDARFEAQEQGKQVVCDWEVSSCLLMADRELLQRAFENIIRNGVFYTADNTAVTVSLLIKAPSVVITVTDHGQGVKEAALSELFLPFVRLNHQQNNVVPGYGLGLAIAARAIQLHQGQVSAHNHPDGGLCVVIDLPYGDNQPPVA